jgi:hypothetical protein
VQYTLCYKVKPVNASRPAIAGTSAVSPSRRTLHERGGRAPSAVTAMRSARERTNLLRRDPLGGIGMTSKPSLRSPEGWFFGLLRTVSMIAVFAAWVLSPFMAAVLANVVSQRWSVAARETLNATLLVITLGSLAIYGDVAFGHIKAKVGFVFLVVPFASWLLIAVVVPIAALVSRRRTP